MYLEFPNNDTKNNFKIQQLITVYIFVLNWPTSNQR